MLIFLDIDGVMVPATGWKTPQNLADGVPMFTKRAIDALRNLISENSTVILSTSHRARFTDNEWKKIFKIRGIDVSNLSSLGSNSDFKKRKDEILEWINTHQVTEDFVIIDDDTSLNALPENLKERLILTRSLIGLTPEDVLNFKNKFHPA